MTTVAATRFRGIKFRSQLDARWAAFFDHLGWPYTYLPLGTPRPTFLVSGDHPFCVLVTGAITPEDYLAESAACSGIEVSVPIVVVGVTPAPYFGAAGSQTRIVADAPFGVAEMQVVTWSALGGPPSLDLLGRSMPHGHQPRTAGDPARSVRAAWIKGTNDVAAVSE